MKEFLIKLLNGINENETTSEQREILRNMQMLKAITLHNKKFYLNDGFVCGKLDINFRGTGYLIPFDNRFKKDLIIENRNLNNAKLGDIILSKILSKKKDKIHAKVVMVIKPAFLTSLVYTKKFGKEILGVNIKTGLAQSLNASQKSLKQLPPFSILKIDNVKNEITEVLGNLEDDFVDEKISLALYNKNSEFSQACEDEAKSFGDFVDKSMYENRVDLTHLDFCTIDPVDAKDFDDAIYFDSKNRELYVAIADVSEYVSAYSAIDKEAKFRGFSIYFPHICVPMLPRALSENICSLKPNEDRLAFVFKIKIDENFNVVNEELFEAIIHSRRRFNYDEVDEILKTKKINEKNLSWIFDLNKICDELRKLRLEKGFDFRTKELRITLDENQKIKSAKFEISTPSHALIEDCMLLANKAAAKRIKRGIFRNHGSADLKKIINLLDDLALLGIEVMYQSDLNALISKIQSKADELEIREEVDKLIIKAQKKAEYSSTPLGHFGLGFDFYTHFTSPIRRYSDLLLHRLLKANMDKNKKLFEYLLLNIEQTCDKLNELEREADKVAYDFIDRKFARWASQNLGNTFRCYIDENSNIVTAKLDDKLKGARIFITNYTCDILTPVLVTITDVDIAKAVIMGRVVKKLDV